MRQSKPKGQLHLSQASSVERYSLYHSLISKKEMGLVALHVWSRMDWGKRVWSTFYVLSKYWFSFLHAVTYIFSFWLWLWSFDWNAKPSQFTLPHWKSSHTENLCLQIVKESNVKHIQANLYFFVVITNNSSFSRFKAFFFSY